MLTAAKKEMFSAPMVWTDECVLPLAASGVYPKTRVWGSKPENVRCSRATPPLRIELRWGCEEYSEKTAVGSGVSFKYDPLGRRVYKSSSSGTSVYAYDGDNSIEETNSSGTVVARYSQGLNIDEPLAMLRSSATSYYQADGLGSITSLSSGAGALAQSYSFDSFGKQTASSGSLTNPFQYTARESDPETGLYYYRARYYDPIVGRFIGEDSSGFRGGINFYAYAHNDPVSFNDPTGLYALKGFTAAQQVDMMNAMAAVKKKLEDCPSCVTDPSLRKQLLGFLAGGNNGSGITFVYEANLKVGCGGTTGFWGITYMHDWTKGACTCLPATIIHELVHHTWQNILIPPIGNWAEKKPEAIDDACYPHPHGEGCKF